MFVRASLVLRRRRAHAFRQGRKYPASFYHARAANRNLLKFFEPVAANVFAHCNLGLMASASRSPVDPLPSLSAYLLCAQPLVEDWRAVFSGS
jgi:hypothetical protein